MKLFAFCLILVGIISTSCNKKEDAADSPPELPPYESMAFNFASFTGSASDTIENLATKHETAVNTYKNFTYSVINVAGWNAILTGVLVVPVASFYAAINEKPVFIGDATWQWSYTLSVGINTYTARLLGKVRSEDVKWEMYVTKTGVLPFVDFLWFEGTSALNGLSGQWILYYSPIYNEKFLQIDWVHNDEGIGEIKYTNIRDLNDSRITNVNKGSYIQAGFTTGDYNGYYNIHGYDSKTTLDFVNINIEWNTTDHYGRVKSPLFYGNDSWNCWDNKGIDISCE